jgi:hypothetical protein
VAVPATARAARVALTVVTAAVVTTARPRLHLLLPKLRRLMQLLPHRHRQ